MNPLSSPLLADLYQFTMLQSYIEKEMEEVAVFELFVRKLPPGRNFLVAAGLEQVVDFLENLRFSPEELEWLATRFPSHVIAYLEKFRFDGDVHAMPEGTLFFPNEPILRITAKLPQAQLVESRIINLIHFETLIASKAARSVLVAPDKLLVDFGMRRAHGAEAGLLAARASYLAGFSGTATVLAGALFDIPLFGTMAHSFIQAHRDESEAFEHFARSHPDNTTLLIDTYDTETAAGKVVALARKLKADKINIQGVRLDSGDLAAHARNVREILNLLAARASYLAGFSGTATVLAGALFDIPLFGTMAHSFIQAHRDESEAFEHFARSHPDNTTLLIDTYDTETAAGKVVALARKLKADKINIQGVRLDSGDLAAHARNVRDILNAAGLEAITIFASGNVDEYKLQTLLSTHAPIDGFGIGTALDISIDAPALDCAYKLQEYAGTPRRKRSEGKATWPGRKQVYRNYSSNGCMAGDIIALEDSDFQPGEPLLQPFMRSGKRLCSSLSLHTLRCQTITNYKHLPAALVSLEPAPSYPVTISGALRAMADQLDMTHTSASR